jgi:hypothetical protein
LIAYDVNAQQCGFQERLTRGPLTSSSVCVHNTVCNAPIWSSFCRAVSKQGNGRVEGPSVRCRVAACCLIGAPVGDGEKGDDERWSRQGPCMLYLVANISHSASPTRQADVQTETPLKPPVLVPQMRCSQPQLSPPSAAGASASATVTVSSICMGSASPSGRATAPFWPAAAAASAATAAFATCAALGEVGPALAAAASAASRAASAASPAASAAAATAAAPAASAPPLPPFCADVASAPSSAGFPGILPVTMNSLQGAEAFSTPHPSRLFLECVLSS